MSEEVDRRGGAEGFATCASYGWNLLSQMEPPRQVRPIVMSTLGPGGFLNLLYPY
jgi:hypothetical protein